MKTAEYKKGFKDGYLSFLKQTAGSIKGAINTLKEVVMEKTDAKKILSRATELSDELDDDANDLADGLVDDIEIGVPEDKKLSASQKLAIHQAMNKMANQSAIKVLVFGDVVGLPSIKGADKDEEVIPDE